MDAELIVIVSTVASLVTLILFFKMVFDVASIKRQLNPKDSEFCFDLAKKYEFKQNKEKALDMYYEGIYLEMDVFTGGYDWNKEKMDVLKKRFESKITALGGKWPDLDILCD